MAWWQAIPTYYSYWDSITASTAQAEQSDRFWRPLLLSEKVACAAFVKNGSDLAYITAVTSAGTLQSIGSRRETFQIFARMTAIFPMVYGQIGE